MQRTYGRSINVIRLPKSGGVRPFFSLPHSTECKNLADMLLNLLVLADLCSFRVLWVLCVDILQAVDRDYAYRQRVRNHQVQNYVYGQKVEIPDRCDNGEGSYLFQHEPTSDLSLAPSSTVVPFDDITIYRIGGGKKPLIVPYIFLPPIRISVEVVHLVNHASPCGPRGFCGSHHRSSFTPSSPSSGIHSFFMMRYFAD